MCKLIRRWFYELAGYCSIWSYLMAMEEMKLELKTVEGLHLLCTAQVTEFLTACENSCFYHLRVRPDSFTWL